jgi:hypothetical protein
MLGKRISLTKPDMPPSVCALGSERFINADEAPPHKLHLWPLRVQGLVPCP